MKSIVSVVLAAVLAAPAARAAAGIESVWAGGGRDFGVSLNGMIKEVEPVDVFLEVDACRVVDSKSLREFSLEQAVGMLQPCESQLQARYGARLAVEAGVLGPTPMGRGAVRGILFGLEDSTPGGQDLLRDLRHSIGRRDGRLMGHPVRVAREGEVRTQLQSSLQDIVDGCMVAAVLRPMRNTAEFLQVYGECLRRAPGLKIKLLSASRRHERALSVRSSADSSVVSRMNGILTVPSEDGPAVFEVDAAQEGVFRILPYPYPN